MLRKKSCPKCGKKINQKDNFCSNCGSSLKDPAKKQKEWGLLGSDDSTNLDSNQNTMGGGLIEKMIGGVAKMLEKEMQKELKNNSNNTNLQDNINQEKNLPNNFKLMINGKEINLGDKKQTKQEKENKQKELTQKDLPLNKLSGFAGNNKKEPSTSVKRFSDKILYEINLPGIESQKELSITKLENSIEVRAKSKNNSYFKVIPIDSPITGYNFTKGKLSLEFSE
ncbi:MAG TPA: zinc ribbon domain-containing protein [Candidatus Nanoarchaeia archaeon]|nr:zinc ribbon domain-containing protein [Candidatus Nanoarchaeia archaeon]